MTWLKTVWSKLKGEPQPMTPEEQIAAWKTKIRECEVLANNAEVQISDLNSSIEITRQDISILKGRAKEAVSLKNEEDARGFLDRIIRLEKDEKDKVAVLQHLSNNYSNYKKAIDSYDQQVKQLRMSIYVNQTTVGLNNVRNEIAETNDFIQAEKERIDLETKITSSIADANEEVFKSEVEQEREAEIERRLKELQ